MPKKAAGSKKRTATKATKKKPAKAAKKTAKKATKTTKAAAKAPAKAPAAKAPARTKSGGALRVRQVRSGIGHASPYRRTLRALGLKHHQDEIVVPDNPSTRGMIHKVRHLVSATPEEA
jgi:large subunit ribosomal protein L30